MENKSKGDMRRIAGVRGMSVCNVGSRDVYKTSEVG